MRNRFSILLLLIALLTTGYVLWTQVRSVDVDLADHLQKADAERHDYVVSHDFDLLKAKLIEVHRDHWTEVSRQERQARIGSICLVAIGLILLALLARELRKKQKVG